MPLSRLTWVYLTATLLLLACGLKIVLLFDLPLWATFAPTRYAASRLIDARVVPGISFIGCASPEARYWLTIADDSAAGAWFALAYDQARSPSGRLLALAGLQRADAAAYHSVRARFAWPGGDSVMVLEPRSSRPAYGREVLNSLDTGSLLRHLQESGSWPEC
jgi:hypothetical protein